MRALVLIALAGFLAPAWGTNTNKPMTLSQIAARQVEAKYGAADAIWRDVGTSHTVTAAASPAGSVVVSSIVKGPSPVAGAVLDVAVKRTLPWASISKAVAKSLPLISTALAIKEIADAIRCREAPGGGSECDPGTPETTQTVWNPSDTKSGFCTQSGATPTAAYGNWRPCAKARVQIQYPSYTVANGVASTCNNTNGQCTGGHFSVRNPGSGTEAFKVGDGNNFTSAQQLACLPVVVNGVTLYPVKGPDNKCMTNIYAPATEQGVTTKVETYGDKAKAPLIVGDLNAGGKPIDHPQPVADPVPDSIVGPRETTTQPDGSTTVKDTVWDLAPTPTGYEWTPRIITKDYPPGAVIPPPGTVTDGTTTTGSAPKEDPITCGLPNTPPCKIDETGTPTTADISKAEVDASKAEGLAKITDIASIQAPAWSWSFQLPTSCSTISVGPFLTQTVVVDLCQYQSMIHDLVGLIWAAFTVWACVGMVGRTFATG